MEQCIWKNIVLEDGGGFIMSAKGWREFRQDAQVIYEKICPI